MTREQLAERRVTHTRRLTEIENLMRALQIESMQRQGSIIEIEAQLADMELPSDELASGKSAVATE